jgi:hypothetical protein
MLRRKFDVRWCVILLFVLIASEAPLKAYTDPGSGIMIWQILAAGFVGILFQVRKITSWIRGRRRP